MTSKNTGRLFLIDVIELYKELTCLWKVSDQHYRDKIKRGQAMEKLLELFKTKDANASLQMVTKKIASMRSSFRKEYNKVKASMRSGAGTGDVHVPKLWYYGHMLFLEDQDTSRESQSISSIFDSLPYGGEEESSEDSTTSEVSSATSLKSETPRRGFKRPASKADQVLEKISKLMENQPLSNVRDKKIHDSFGEYVAEKLRGLDPLMATYCQKLINEAIFLAETHQLNYLSKIVLAQPPSSFTSNECTIKDATIVIKNE